MMCNYDLFITFANKEEMNEFIDTFVTFSTRDVQFTMDEEAYALYYGDIAITDAIISFYDVGLSVALKLIEVLKKDYALEAIRIFQRNDKNEG